MKSWRRKPSTWHDFPGWIWRIYAGDNFNTNYWGNVYGFGGRYWRSNTTAKIMWGSQKERKSTSGERKWEIKSNIWTKHSQLLVEENLEHAGCQKKKDLPNGCTACQQTSMYPEFWGLGGLPRVPAWPGFMKPCGPRVWGPPWGPPPCPCPIPRFNVPMWPYLQAVYWE